MSKNQQPKALTASVYLQSDRSDLKLRLAQHELWTDSPEIRLDFSAILTAKARRMIAQDDGLDIRVVISQSKRMEKRLTQ